MHPVADGADHVPALYERWARVEAHGSSPVYERLALAVAGDGAAQALLARLEPARRQPNLLFGAMRSLGAPVDDCAAALSWLSAHGHDVLDVMRVRRTQTNEVARCAVLLPALALLPEPLAVLEVGASAGLCLLYDRWRYRYAGVGGDHEVGDPASPVTLECAVSGAVPLPERVPTIAWRLGLDLHPLDPADPDARAWLRALVWPEHTDRATRLSAALDVAATDPPPVETGELLRDLPRLLDRAPANTTVVVTHSATLAHLEAEQRGAFLRVLADAGVHRLGMEGTAVLPGLADQVAGGTAPAASWCPSTTAPWPSPTRTAVTSPGSESGGGSASADPRAGAPAPALLHQRETEWNGAGSGPGPDGPARLTPSTSVLPTHPTTLAPGRGTLGP